MNIPPEDKEPDKPLIRVSKTFYGLSQEQIDQLVDFKIIIVSEDGNLETQLTLNDYHERKVEANGGITYKWEIEDWPSGTYIVSEQGEELNYYEVITENVGHVTTTAAVINWTQNLWKKPNTQEYNDLNKPNPPNIVATKLTEGEGVFVWTEERLSASQRLAIVNALSGFNELGLTIDNGFWYSGEDIGDGFYFRGYEIQYNINTGILHIPIPKQWALIVSGLYYFTGGEPADIAVTNTYNISTVDVLVRKEITGNFADYDEIFDFVVTGYPDFNLGNAEEHTIQNVAKGSIIEFMEESGEYTVTVIINGDEENPIAADTDGFYRIPVGNENVSILVINDRSVDIDTSVNLDNLPYILLMGFSVLGFIAISRKRKLN